VLTSLLTIAAADDDDDDDDDAADGAVLAAAAGPDVAADAVFVLPDMVVVDLLLDMNRSSSVTRDAMIDFYCCYERMLFCAFLRIGRDCFDGRSNECRGEERT
jgi:hypothetical protein